MVLGVSDIAAPEHPRAFDAMKVARQVVEQYLRSNRWMRYTYDELLSDAAYGVALAVRRWDPQIGPFPRYARLRAEGALIDGVRRRSHIPHSRWVRGSSLEDSPEHERPPVSIDPEELAWREPVEPCRQMNAIEARVVIDELLEHLTDRERLVVAAVDLLGVPQADVAGALGVTPSRVCQVRRVALGKMRDEVPDRDAQALLAAA